MVDIYCNTNSYEYDIRALVMGFFPGEELSYHIDSAMAAVNTPGSMSDADAAVSIYINLSSTEQSVTVHNGDNETSGVDIATEDMSQGLYRDVLKRLVYRVLSENLGITLCWGTLTGVRPAKLPVSRLMQGENFEDTVRYMMDNYYCSRKKALLCTQVAAKEIDILNAVGYEQGYSIYIGIPFCPTVCTYCSFSSTAVDGIPGAEDMMENYVTALEKECKAFGNIYPDKKLTTIYIGGGTPTALNEAQLKRLMDIVHSTFDVDGVYEYTVEAGRPDSINEEKLNILKAGGVTRISVNPQTMKQDTLHAIGRKHTVEQTVEAYNMARKAGFDNINMDLIAGLQGEDTEDFMATLEYIDELKPDSFTVHSLVVKRASVYRQQKESGIAERTVGSADAMLDIAAEYAGGHDYMPYYMYRQKNKAGLGDSPVLENVGYAKEGREGIYNILIMEERQTIIAFGAGAASKIVYNNMSDGISGQRIERIANVKNINEYISRIDEMIERKKRCLYAGE